MAAFQLPLDWLNYPHRISAQNHNNNAQETTYELN
ncbi:MAG: hypothetical protein ACI9EP_000741 [Oceanospirillaceae bacterium]|jgi:hypothetical protein